MSFTNFAGVPSEEKLSELIFPTCPHGEADKYHALFNKFQQINGGVSPIKIDAFCLGSAPKQMWIAEAYYNGLNFQGYGSSKSSAILEVKFQFMRSVGQVDSWANVGAAVSLDSGTLKTGTRLVLTPFLNLRVEVFHATYIYLRSNKLYYLTAAGPSKELAILFLRSLLA
ncbi:hypothetical protein [Beihai hepe-like virus 10]|uniref:hypothetical protein n=1 Tax=Beihai hepe-like virus 10 TaxID=1922381 RepID=UPI00090B4C4B|nr:hypothetical protein [Beihai hepe-like virus 10]APG77595.1 hypothetical protein [Beihai hepe-like virus 10]